MAIRIVDHQPLDMTDQEYVLYQNIVKSYTHGQNNGETLFSGLFESDGNGTITLLVPPTKQRTTLEVFLFLMTVSQNQHMRLMHAEIDNLARQIKVKITEIDDKVAKLNVK
jgi:hypothetical protein